MNSKNGDKELKEKLNHELKLSNKFQQRSSKFNNETEYPPLANTHKQLQRLPNKKQEDTNSIEDYDYLYTQSSVKLNSLNIPIGKNDYSNRSTNASPLSKTPDSNYDTEQLGLWSSMIDLAHTNKQNHLSNTSESEILEDDSCEDEDEYTSVNNEPKWSKTIIQQRLETFKTNILNNESQFLYKLKYLKNFRLYLEENFIINGLSQADINILFANTQDIFKCHQEFQNKIQQFELYNDNFDDSYLNDEYILFNLLKILNSMLINSFTIYLEFLNNFPKVMNLLNKLENDLNVMYFLNKHNNHRKSFHDCERDFFQNQIESDIALFSNISQSNKMTLNVTQIFNYELLRRPIKLVEYQMFLKEEFNFYLHENKPKQNDFLTQFKIYFDNVELKNLKEEIFSRIDRNVLPSKIRKNEDVVELCDNSERKLRHLVLFGDCLVCCRIKKDKKQVKWWILMDRLEIIISNERSLKSENEINNLRNEVASLTGDLKRKNETNENSSQNRRLQKKLNEQQAALTLQSSSLKLIIRNNHRSLTQSSTQSIIAQNVSSNPITKSGLYNIANANQTLAVSMSNLAGLGNNQTNNLMNSSVSSISNSDRGSSKDEKFTFLFTSDFDRISWFEEINGAIYAYKTQKSMTNVTQSEIENRINNLKFEDSSKNNVYSNCTGTLELLIKNLEKLSESNRLFIAVEVKSFGSYLQVAQTKTTDLTNKPNWDEKFNLELQCVDSIRIILYCETNSKPLALGSHEIKIDAQNLSSTKSILIRLSNNLNLNVQMKFLSPKKTITRRRTKHKNDLFGNKLNDILQKEKSTIPRILRDCVEVIETKGIDETGIYRVSAVVSEVHKMKELFSKNPNQALVELRNKTPHLAANLLKLYLRELPEPLFTAKLYPDFIQAVEVSNDNDRDSMLCKTFSQLPETNKDTLLFVLNHLLNIASHSPKNMMGIQNLSTLFGPTLMKLSPKDKPEMDDMAREIRESMQQASVLFYILKLHSNHKLLQINFDNENNNINETAIAHLQQIAQNASRDLPQRRTPLNRNHNLQTAL